MRQAVKNRSTPESGADDRVGPEPKERRFAAGLTERWLRRLVMPVAILVLWQVSVEFYGFGGGFVPTPVKVVETLWVWIGGGGAAHDQYSGTWLASVWASAQRVAAGFAAAGVVGVTLGVLIGRSRLMADLIDPIVQILRPIPVSAWVPFSIIFFGLSPAAAIFLVGLGAFFPVVLNTTAGARHVSHLHLRSARMLGASPLRTLLCVILPSALPSIMVGLRLAMGLAWVLLIVAEMVAVRSGLGYDLWNAYYYSRMDVIVGAMLTIGLLGFLSDRIIVEISARVLRWQEASDQ